MRTRSISLRRALGPVLVLASLGASIATGGAGASGDPASAGSSTATSTTAPAPAATASRPGPGLIGHQGRWLTDAAGRVRLLAGVNVVSKSFTTIEGMRFGAADAEALVDQGFDVVRLGLSPDALMPRPGVVNRVYLASYARSLRMLTDHGLLVLVDLHQDGWGRGVCGNGFPRWMTLTHGAPNTCTDFPLYYVTNPAISAAFQSLWDNDQVAGRGLQDWVAVMFQTLAREVGDNPNVLGYDILNEPWPGTDFGGCLIAPGCAEVERQGLDELHAKVTKAIRAVDRTHLIFGEPYSLFNSGEVPTFIGLPGGDPRGGMAFHMYTVDAAKETEVLRYAIDWSRRTGGALLAGEFGATNDVAVIERMVGEMDDALVPWIFWSWDENLVSDTANGTEPRPAVVQALSRPHLAAVAGTPTKQRFTARSRSFVASWRTVAPGGRRVRAAFPTEIKVPAQVYGSGYTVKVTGGTVTSADDAPVLTVANTPGAPTVTVTVTPTL